MSDDGVAVTVVVASSGQRPQLLERTLADLAAAELPAGYQGAVIVENGTDGGAEAVVRQADARVKARYLHLPRPSKSAALNAGLEAAADGLIVFLDDDIRVGEKLLIAYADAAERAEADPGAPRFFGGPIDVAYEQEPEPWLRRYLPPSARGFRLKDPSELGKRCFVGINWAAFRQDLLDLGGFDLNYGPGSPTFSTGEETLAQDQLRERGIEGAYVPEAWVEHWVPADRCTADWVVLREYRRSAQKALFAKHWGRERNVRLRAAGRAAAAPVMGLLARVRPTPRREFQARRFRAIVQGLRAGLRNESSDARQ